MFREPGPQSHINGTGRIFTGWLRGGLRLAGIMTVFTVRGLESYKDSIQLDDPTGD